MERELEKDLKEIEYLIYVHKNRGNTNTQSVLERVHEIIEPCAKAARTLSELEALLFRENGQETTRSSRDHDGWIPVEERLPEPYQQVLISMYNNLTYVTVGHYSAYERKWHAKKWISDWGVDVKAWRPLPEPYRPEQTKEGERR